MNNSAAPLSMEPCVIRKANAADASAIVVEADGSVCATALLTLCPDAMYRAQPFGVVENVVVASAMRGRGLGRRLLTEVERLAVVHRCTKLMLSSGAARHEAHAFFRRCGFADDTKRAFVKYRRQFSAS
jgi:GNAT superfamily N-acetyltransferase